MAWQAPRSSVARPGTVSCRCRLVLDPRAGQLSVGRSLYNNSGGRRPPATATVTGPVRFVTAVRVLAVALLTITGFYCTLIPSLYKKTKNQMAEVIKGDINTQDLASLCLTSHIWTSDANESFVSATLQYVNQDFTLRKFLFTNSYFPGSHDSVKIKEKIKSVMKEYDLLETTVPAFVVTDNTANISNSINGNWIHLTCFAHTVKLVISYAKSLQEVWRGSSKCHAIAGHYKHSYQARERLHALQKLNDEKCLEVTQDVTARWNREFLMLERQYTMKKSINTELAVNPCSVSPLTEEDWHLAESYIAQPQPLHQATKEVCLDTTPSLSMVLPIEKKGSAGVTLSRNIHKALNGATRFPKTYSQQNPSHLLSILLDPWFKNEILPENEKIVAHGKLQSEVEEFIRTTSQLVHSEEGLSCRKNHFKNARFMIMVRRNITQFLALKKVVRKYLPIPATSAASEHAGNIVTSKRRCLTEEHVKELVFLHEILQNLTTYTISNKECIYSAEEHGALLMHRVEQWRTTRTRNTTWPLPKKQRPFSRQHGRYHCCHSSIPANHGPCVHHRSHANHTACRQHTSHCNKLFLHWAYNVPYECVTGYDKALTGSFRVHSLTTCCSWSLVSRWCSVANTLNGPEPLHHATNAIGDCMGPRISIGVLQVPATLVHMKMHKLSYISVNRINRHHEVAVKRLGLVQASASLACAMRAHERTGQELKQN
ncbi:hypothetical protein PR048_001144 [Dryococelus australis]|uniref:HAT C-terminal dimerisation domain-containing protein n=1 Tax=Dryococelus australis TaxID=614101 RepID=A0ABQ9IHI4_9NEOP|nr:hypothetical protein PR048_001144 [Dryococelus australis]